MHVYSKKETKVGEYIGKVLPKYKDYELNEIARQLMLIYETLTLRLKDANVNDMNEIVIERGYVYDNNKPPKYSYEGIPDGIKRYFWENLKHNSLKEFIDWFLKERQQPKDYLIYGVIKHESHMRGDGLSKNVETSEYKDNAVKTPTIKRF